MYVQRLARHLGTSEQAVSERIGRRRPGASSRQPEPALGRNSPNQETFLLATLLRFDELRPAFGPVIPEQFFSDALEREIFVLWRNGGERAPAGDPVDNKWIELEELRLPPFTIDRAREDVRRKIERIKRERDIAHLAAAAERMAEIERETGSAAVASIGSNAWRGVVAAPGDREAAEIVLELQQLSQSMHRHEDIAETP
jgi:hypothetical protein